MNIEIREFRNNDYKEVYDLLQNVHDMHLRERPDIYVSGSYSFDIDEFESIIKDKNSITRLAEYEGKVAGFCIANVKETIKSPIIAPRKFAFIESLYVNEEYRRKGIARKLYNSILEASRKHEVDSIELMVWDFNQEGIMFYRSLGMNIKNYRMEKKLN